MNITIIFIHVLTAEVYKNIELLISMSKDEQRRSIGKNISGSTPKIRSGKSFAHLSQNKDRYDLPPVEGEMAHSAKGGVRKTPAPTSSVLPLKKGQKASKPSFMQNALKTAAMFALAFGTTSISSDTQAQASSNFLNIRGATDIEQQVLEEQTKHRKFLTNKSGTKFTNKVVSTNILRINPEVLNAVQNSIGQRDGVMRDLALRASEATLTDSSLLMGDGAVVGDSLTNAGEGVVVGINSIETIEVESGVKIGYTQDLPPVEGEMGDSPKGVNNTQPPTPTSSVLPPASMGQKLGWQGVPTGLAQATISPLERKELQNETELSFSNSREGYVLALTGTHPLPNL